MCDHARRLRIVAALGLMLAVAQAPAWGSETIWTKAVKLVCRIGELPQLLTPKQQPAEEQHTPLFVWEKKDAVERQMTLAHCDEIVGDYQWAYYRYKAIARRYSSKQASAAVERLGRMKRDAPSPFSDGCGCLTMCGLAIHCLNEGDCWLSDVDSLDRSLPERKDMLPDTDRTQMLIDFGIIPAAAELLSLPNAEEPRGGDGRYDYHGGPPIIF